MDSFLGRFENAITLLQSDPDYAPTRPDIQKVALLSFVASLHQCNTAVSLAEANLKTLRNQRTNLAFKHYSTTPDTTIEAVIDNIAHYIAAENGVDNSVYKAIKAYLTKIRPHPKSTKTDGSKGPSRSEKTFTALAGYFENIVHLIGNTPTLVYNPTNPALKVSTLLSFSDSFSQLNKDIAGSERDEKAARKDRQDLFNGEKGAKTMAKDIKQYLLSYVGGKQNAKYVQFTSALA